MDLGSISWGSVAICGAIIAWFAVAVWITRPRKGNPPEFYHYSVSAEWTDKDGKVCRSDSTEYVTVTIPAPEDCPVHIDRHPGVFYSGPISRK